jgi:hypothetical protein
MILTLVDINYVRKGVWILPYTASCDCGCKTSRHTALYYGKKPSIEKANQLIDADYNK